MNHKKPKALLVFPPVWLPESPFLSTAILTAYLQKHQVNVEQRDLNIEFWSHFYKSDVIHSIYEKICKYSAILSSKEKLTPYESHLLRSLATVKGLTLDRFEYEVKEKIIDQQLYKNFIQGLSAFNSQSNKFSSNNPSSSSSQEEYHDLLYSDISLSHLAESTLTLKKIVTDKSSNPYYEYFKSQILPSLLLKKLDVIGISIVAVNQVVPTFTLAYLIKEQDQDIHIVIGGSWCTQVRDNLSASLHEFPYIDSMVVFEGEEPFRQICEAVANNRTLENIPNLYYRTGDSIRKNSQVFSMQMNELPPPAFEGLPLKEYEVLGSFPIQISRGCYWGKCTFCSYPSQEPKYKVRNSECIAKDLETLQSKYGASSFTFVDALMSPNYAKRIAKIILEKELDVSWNVFARFEEGFSLEVLQAIAETGCVQVSWGLESACNRVLRIIDKGISIPGAEKILATASDLGIHNRVLVMYGHPTETFEEAKLTIEFIEKNLSNIHSISCNYYHPEESTPFESLADKLGIQLIKNNASNLFFGYEWASLLTENEKAYIHRQYRELSRKLEIKSNRSDPIHALAILQNLENNDQHYSFISEFTFNGNSTHLLSFLELKNNNLHRSSFTIKKNFVG